MGPTDRFGSLVGPRSGYLRDFSDSFKGEFGPAPVLVA
jgi:hypothetical protein